MVFVRRSNFLVSTLRKGLAFIFDMDGVVLDSNPLHNESWRIYLEKNSIVAEDIEARMLGKRNDEIVRDFFGGDLTPEQIFQHGAAKEQLYRELMAPHKDQKLTPGLLQFLEKHRDVPKAIASNAEPLNVSFVLGLPELAAAFPIAVDGHQVKHPKPSPDIYLEAARRLTVTPGACIVFEDSNTGVQAARAAGMRVVGLATNGHPLPGVDLLIRDFLDPQLESWLSAQ